MQVWNVEAAHKDDRGSITDLIVGHGCVDAVTVVRSKAGAVRGNHYHDETRQWAYVVSGRLLVTDGVGTAVVGPGGIVRDEPGEPHAWKALEDTVCVVFVQGPRAGDGYESDTIRLEEPIFT